MVPHVAQCSEAESGKWHLCQGSHFRSGRPTAPCESVDLLRMLLIFDSSTAPLAVECCCCWWQRDSCCCLLLNLGRLIWCLRCQHMIPSLNTGSWPWSSVRWALSLSCSAFTEDGTPNLRGIWFHFGWNVVPFWLECVPLCLWFQFNLDLSWPFATAGVALLPLAARRSYQRVFSSSYIQVGIFVGFCLVNQHVRPTWAWRLTFQVIHHQSLVIHNLVHMRLNQPLSIVSNSCC